MRNYRMNYPPFGTPRAMTIRLVEGHPEPAVLARWHWWGLLSAAFPLRDGTRHPEMGNDCHGARRADGFTDPPPQHDQRKRRMHWPVAHVFGTVAATALQIKSGCPGRSGQQS